MSTRNTGKMRRHPSSPTASRPTRYVLTTLPTPFTNCARLRLLAKRPGSDTSRMIGLPATCRNVVPTPSTNTPASSSAKPGTTTVGTRTPSATRARASSIMFFFPIRAAKTPPGTLKIANATNANAGSRPAMKPESEYCFWMVLASGPIASTKPIAKNTRKIGSVRTLIVSLPSKGNGRGANATARGVVLVPGRLSERRGARQWCASGARPRRRSSRRRQPSSSSALKSESIGAPSTAAPRSNSNWPWGQPTKS